MALRKSPTMTPARLEANRRNAQKSTGPRTARGKAKSCMNHWSHGWRSRLEVRIANASVTAPLGHAEEAIRAVLPPELAKHPLFRTALEYARQEDAVATEALRREAAKRRTGERALRSQKTFEA